MIKNRVLAKSGLNEQTRFCKKFNKSFYVTILLIFIGAIALCWLLKNEDKFFILKIEGYSAANIPYCKVDVKNQIIQSKIDLGYTGSLALPHSVLSTLEHPNNFNSQHISYGLNGKQYPVNAYYIDKITIGNMDFPLKEIEESNVELEKQMVLHDVDPHIFESMGRIGWQLFKDYLLLIDCKNDRLCLCKNLDTLKNHGYLVETLTVTPFNLDSGFIEFEAVLDSGVTRCILDTGSTRNLSNQRPHLVSNNKPLFDLEDTFNTSLFQIGNKNFGPVTFNRIYSPLPLNAIVGMEFFEDNLVIIDFKQRNLYFSPI